MGKKLSTEQILLQILIYYYRFYRITNSEQKKINHTFYFTEILYHTFYIMVLCYFYLRVGLGGRAGANNEGASSSVFLSSFTKAAPLE